MPPGWDRWIGYQGGPTEQRMRGAFKVNVQGKVVRIDATEEHDTDYFARKAEDYVRNRKPGKPRFLMIATMPSRSRPGLRAQRERRADYAEDPLLQRGRHLGQASLARQRAATRGVPIKAAEHPGEKLQCVDEADEAWRNRMESLRDVDDMIAELLVALRDEGFARHTYVILTSDNGFELYQNRVYSKGSPYEPSQRVPFIVRGPGVSKDRVDHHLVANIDLAPTFAQWAKARTPDFVDGRSLVPILDNPNAPWRTRLLFEHHLGNQSFEAIRTSAGQVYVPEHSRDGVLRSGQGSLRAPRAGRNAAAATRRAAQGSHALLRGELPRGGRQRLRNVDRPGPHREVSLGDPARVVHHDSRAARAAQKVGW